jgi:hypothetical protein
MADGNQATALKRIFYSLAVTVVGFWLLSLALKYGGIWDSQANPTLNAQVELKDGRVVEGSLSSGWDEQYILKSNDGTHIEFREFRVIRTSAPPKTETGHPLLRHWRGTVPVLIVGWVMAIAILLPLREVMTQLWQVRHKV